MKYNGKDLNCNNFRELLKEYSVDIQDVVRSALMDGVDIEKYINDSDPYKLDQIRLSIKEGSVSEKYFVLSGKHIHKLRQLDKDCIDYSCLKDFINGSKIALSDEHLDYVFDWLYEGISLNGLNVRIIPKKYLPLIDKGLKLGLNMEKYSVTKYAFSTRYLDSCLQLEKMGKNVDFLLKEEFNQDVVDYLVFNNNMSKSNWESLSKVLRPKDDLTRVTYLTILIRNGINVTELQNKNVPTKCLNILISAYKEGLDLKPLMDLTSEDEMNSMVNNLLLKKNQKVSGRIIKKSN